MNRAPQDQRTFRVARTLVILALLTAWSLYVLNGDFFPPHGHPLVFAIAMSWLVNMAVIVATGAFFSSADPALFALAKWEKEGAIYDRAGVRAFRWVLLRSPFGWVNPNFHLSARRTECHRLLRETHNSEGVHWLTGSVSVALAVAYFVHGDTAYGYAMLLIRIPWDVYPILLQRWNRGRVHRVLRRELRPPV
jgi:glycosyl-4,4'-diaponeurosporenoate acyltransferase